ncbi:MAG: HPF/RaiA family ribosome-associated protein [Candidatus Dadabacteria bacterium]|nr:HPF/RaiA family ribosome-associated protein [Candidatus Dadabacteria bacterium]
MKTDIITKNISDRKKSEHLKRYAMKKMPKLKRYIDPERKPSEAKIILSAEKLRNNAEMTISSGSLKASASVETNEMHSAIDKLFDTIIKQLRRRTDKQVTLRRRNVSKIPYAVRTQRSEMKNNLRVDHQYLNSKPMSVMEALLQLDASEENFVAFKNRETLEMNVVYKKADSKKVGLLTP